MKMLTRFRFASLAFLIAAGSAQQSQQNRIGEWEALQISLRTAKSIHPKKGFIPDELTAVSIGEAVAIAQYGRDTIVKEEPFHARLYGDTWLVHGTLHPQGAFGGTAVVKVSQKDGRILFLTHQE